MMNHIKRLGSQRGMLRLAAGALLSALVCHVSLPGVQALAEDKELIVLAASSLTDVLPKAAARWKEHGGAAIFFSFDASSRLARQIESGAPASLFFSADVGWMDYLEPRGRIVKGSRMNLWGNQLVLAAPKNSSLAVDGPGALAKAPLKRLALAGENVPAGKYAETALRNLGCWDALSGRIVRAGNARATLEWAARGEVDAAVSFETDARANPKIKVLFVFPEASHAPIVYTGVVVQGAPRAEDAKRFLAFCRGPEARRLFQEAGFTVFDDNRKMHTPAR